MTAGILSYGAYVPFRRLQRAAVFNANSWFAGGLKGLAKGERAIANWDEDAITMAVEASRDCLTGVDRSTVQALTLASTTLPFADRLNSGVVKEALTLNDAVAAADATGSQRAGLSALIQALRGTETRLCAAAELRKAKPASEGELVHGDGAAAILVGPGEAIATCLRTHSVTIDFVDHFRASDAEFDYTWESRWIREEGYAKLMADALGEALAAFGVAGKDISRAVLPISVKGVPASLAKGCGIPAEAVADTLNEILGDTGAAHPLMMLAAALEQARPGEKVLVAAFGQGVDVALLETTPALSKLPARTGVKGHLARRQPDENYMRFLFHRGLVDLEKGIRAELDEKQPGTTLYRQRKSVLGLVGGRCAKTGAIQFPKTDISVNQNDRAQFTQEDYPLAEKRARITTYTADSLTYSPNPPNYYGMVDFEGGGRMACEFADATPEDIEVGREMRMMFRIKAIDEQRKFKRYFWKAAPMKGGD